MGKTNTQNCTTTTPQDADDASNVSAKIGVTTGYIQGYVERPCHNYVRPETLNEEK